MVKLKSEKFKGINITFNKRRDFVEAIVRKNGKSFLALGESKSEAFQVMKKSINAKEKALFKILK